MRTKPPRLAPIFRSEMQMRLLALLLLQPARQWTLAELADALGAPSSSVHRELHRALDSGLIEQDASQRPHLFFADAESPFFAPVALLLRRSVGVEAALRDALSDLAVEAAAIHGSWADPARRARGGSDIDLVVVGDVTLQEVRRRVRPVAKEAGRTVDVTVFDADEFRRLVGERSSFARHLLNDDVTSIVGSLQQVVDR